MSTELVPTAAGPVGTGATPNPLMLLNEGKPVVVDLDQYPSLKALANANRRGAEDVVRRMREIEAEIEVLQEKEERLVELELGAQGVRSQITRRRTQLANLEKVKCAYEACYMEVPDQGGDFLFSENWVSPHNLPSDVPVDVLDSLLDAKASGIFDEFRIYRPAPRARRRRDPMIVGIIGDSVFYIGFWR